MSFLSNLFQSGVYKEPSTGLEFPETIDAYERGKVIPSKTGIYIEYRSLGEGAQAFVFIRALGGDAEKTSEYFLNEYLRQKKVLETYGEYPALVYNTEPEKEKPGWKSAMFTRSIPDQCFAVSFILFKVTATHLLEIHADTNNSNIESAKSFIQSLQGIMDKPASTP
jgi:hypothetical protein